MITSRLFFGFARPGLTQKLSARFAYANATRAYNNMKSKIQSSRNFGEFSQILESKKGQVSIIDVCSSSKHISGLINSRQRIELKDVQNLISFVQKSDLSTLNVRNLINILVLFRNIKQKKIYLEQLQTIKNKIAIQVGNLIKQKIYREDQANQLASAYFEFSKQKIYGEAKMVANKILLLMEEAIKSDRTLFNNAELSFLVVSLSLRPNPTYKQIRIRQIILERLTKQSQVLPIEELVKIVSCFAKMQTYDFKSDQFSNIKQLVQRVAERTDELDENQLLQLLRAKSSIKLPGYFDFLQKIRNNIFDAINSEGKSDIDSEAIFKVLPLVSSKTSLRDDDRLKIIAFLENFAKQCKTDLRKFSMKTLDIVINPCLDSKGKQAFSKILQKYQFQLTINMMYQMALNRFNIEFLSKQISLFSFDKLTRQYIYKIGYTCFRISKSQPSFQPVWEQIRASIAQDFSTPQKFIQTFKFFLRGDIKMEDLSDIINPEFNTLPNPFEDESHGGAYTYYYTQVVLKCWKNKDVYQFITKYQAKIKLSDLLKISSQMIEEQQQSTSYSRPVITAITKRSNEIIDSKVNKDISALINLVGKFNRIVVYSQIDNFSLMNIFKIIRNLHFKLKTLQQLNLDGLYYSILEKYITRSGNNYNFQHSFKSFIKYLLNHMFQISKSKLQALIIEEGMALDYVTKRHLDTIDLDKLYLPYFTKTRAYYIKDPSYVPELTRFTNNSLEVILTNPNLEKYIQSNYKAIVEKIKSLEANQAVYLASIFNIHKSAHSRKLMSELLTIVSEKLKSSNRCNILGLFDNALDNNYYSFYQYKKIVQKVVDDFKKYVYVYSIESHAELIRFLISQPGMNDEEYFTKIIQYFQKRDDISDNALDLLYNRLSSTNFNFNEKQIQSIERMVKNNITAALHFFCMIEQLIPESNRSNYVKQIAQKIAQTLEKQQEKEVRFNSAYIQYLKKVYPSQAGFLNIPEDRIYVQRISFKPNEEFNSILNKISDNAVEQIKLLSQDNYIVKIKENIIIFISPRKLGSYYQHEFIKRYINILHQKPINVVCVCVGQQTVSVIEFLNKSCPNTFNEKMVQLVIQQVKEKRSSQTKKKLQNQEQ